MNAPRNLLCAAVIGCLGLASPTEGSMIWFDLSGWDHGQVTGGGQTFHDVIGTVDVTVSASGNHPVPSEFTGAWIYTGNNSDANQFTFDFSEPLDLVLEVRTLDAREMMTITSDGSKSYNHLFGAVPTLQGDIALTGNGFGINPTGASRGIIHSSSTSSLVVDYQALTNNKFELFRIGTGSVPAVPEPGTGMLAAASLIGMLMMRRRSKLPS